MLMQHLTATVAYAAYHNPFLYANRSTDMAVPVRVSISGGVTIFNYASNLSIQHVPAAADTEDHC
jgi:hypothetical protein